MSQVLTVLSAGTSLRAQQAVSVGDDARGGHWHQCTLPLMPSCGQQARSTATRVKRGKSWSCQAGRQIVARSIPKKTIRCDTNRLDCTGIRGEDSIQHAVQDAKTQPGQNIPGNHQQARPAWRHRSQTLQLPLVSLSLNQQMLAHQTIAEQPAGRAMQLPHLRRLSRFLASGRGGLPAQQASLSLPPELPGEQYPLLESQSHASAQSFHGCQRFLSARQFNAALQCCGQADDFYKTQTLPKQLRNSEPSIMAENKSYDIDKAALLH